MIIGNCDLKGVVQLAHERVAATGLPQQHSGSSLMTDEVCQSS